MPTLLKKLGIPSPRHAAEIERDLGIRFSDFTPEHCDTWKEQTLYLYQFAMTRTTTHAARTAGITLAAARQWRSDNTLGFNQRLDDAVLEYTDDMEVLFLERTRQPDSPTSFMTTLLRAQMPEKYGPARRSTPSRDNHCDHDRGDDQDSEHTPAPSNNNQPSLADIQRQLEQLQHLTDKAHPNLSPARGRDTERGRSHTQRRSRSLPHRPSTRRGRFQTCPCSLPNHGRDTQRGHTPTPSTYHPAPIRPNPPPTPRTPAAGQTQTPKIPPPPRPQLNHTHGPFTNRATKEPRVPVIPAEAGIQRERHTQNPEPNTQNSSSPAGHPNTPYSLRNTFLFPLFFLPHAIP